MGLSGPFIYIYINLPPGIYQSQTLPGDDLLFALLASRAGALGIFQLKPLGEETYGPMVLSMFVAQLGYPKIQCLILVDDRLGVSETLCPKLRASSTGKTMMKNQMLGHPIFRQTVFSDIYILKWQSIAVYPTGQTCWLELRPEVTEKTPVPKFSMVLPMTKRIMQP